MKSLKIISILFCLAVVVGCIKEFPPMIAAEQGVSPSIVINMNVYNNSTATRSSDTFNIQDGILGTGEYVIDRLRVYVFASNGKLDKMEIYDELNCNGVFNHEIEVPSDQSKKLYFVANEPSQLSSQLEGVTSAEQLKDMAFDIAAAMNGAFNAAATFTTADLLMPMSTEYDLNNATSDISISIGLTRAVARVDLFLKKDDGAASRQVALDGSTVVSATNATSQSLLFAHQVVDKSDFRDPSVVSSDVELSSKSPIRVFSFYTAERKYDLASSAITIQVDGLLEAGSRVTTPQSVVLGDKGSLKELNRNYVYRIYGSYNGNEIIADDLKIMDWEDVEVDGEIEGVMVAVDSQVAMDWLRSGNTYASKSVSFGSNKPISFYLPILSSDGGVNSYEFKKYEFANMSAGSSYDLTKIALVNNYIDATDWIESATIHFTSPQSGYIDFVYRATKVDYHIQTYPIRIKSDNVVKQMKAVYDNGYIPTTALSARWAGRAPGGVVLAKRGEAKHPVSTPDVYYRDEDGYYRGEHSITADAAARYCTETFGEGWYVPSHDDMIEIATMYDMLGVSYRFQNNGSAFGSGELTESRYWTATGRSSSDFSQYWSADFQRREYMTEGLLELRDASQSYFVRCVKDLQ